MINFWAEVGNRAFSKGIFTTNALSSLILNFCFFLRLFSMVMHSVTETIGRGRGKKVLRSTPLGLKCCVCNVWPTPSSLIWTNKPQALIFFGPHQISYLWSNFLALVQPKGLTTMIRKIRKMYIFGGI